MANSRDFLLGMTIGGLIGSAVGLLYAPKPGAETVQELIEQANNLKQRVAEVAENLQSAGVRVTATISDGKEKGVRLAAVQKESVQAAVRAGKQAYLDTAEKLRQEGAETAETSETESQDNGA